MNLLTSFEPNRGSGRSCSLLAVNLRAMVRASYVSSAVVGVSVRVGDRSRRAYFFLAPLAGAALLAGAPYFERACLRSATPRQSSTPRTMW